ncbi:hypothetical protein [Streptomyces sp. WG-D5]
MGGEEPDARRRAGELVAELGRKMAEFGPAALRVVTVEEAERERIDWFLLGWQEHARLVSDESGEPAPAPGHDGRNTSDTPRGTPRDTPHPRLRVADGEEVCHGEAPDGEVGHGEVSRDTDGEGHGEREDGGRDTFPLPVVGAAEAEVRELMPHRLRSRGRQRP